MTRQILIIVSGEAAGSHIHVQGEMIVGREGDEVPALAEDSKLSRRHARLSLDADGVLAVEDLNSMNGTFVNGVQIVERQLLTVGDLVRVGDTTIEVRLEDEATQAFTPFASEQTTQTTDELPVPVEQVGSPTALRSPLDLSNVAPPASLLHDGERLPIPVHGLAIGRLQENDLVIDSELASRTHARVVPAEGRYFVADLGSANGTYLNGERLLGESRWLNAGDTITIGEEAMRFLTGQETHAGSGPALKIGVEAVRFDGRRLTIGRDQANDVHLEAPSISRFHAEIVASNGTVELRDLGSRNGTRLDGERVGRAALRAGSEIGVGPFRLIFDGFAFLRRDDRGALRLDAYDIAVTTRDKAILNQTSLSVQPGEFVAVIGESGSGKTTLMRALAGVSKPSGGVVLVNGEPVESRLADIGYLPQDEIVHPRLSILESLGYSAQLRLPPDAAAADIEDAVSRVLAETGLEEQARTRIGSLSGGQRKRVGLATELLDRPGLLFLDEPTTGLDPGLETRMMELFRRLAAVGSHALLVVTHATRNLELVDRLCVLGRGGYTCFLGTPEEAKAFFGVSAFDDIYTALDERPADEWHRDFQASHPRPESPVDASSLPLQAAPNRPQQEASLVRSMQARVLTARYLKVFTRDRRNVLLLLLQVPLIAVAMALLFRPDVFAPPGLGRPSSASQLLFILVVTMIWLGTISSARELIKERPVFIRERAVGVRVDAYLASKFGVLVPLVVAQAALLAIIVFKLRPLHEPASVYTTLFIALALTGLVAVAMGLLISALVRTEEQAMALIPIAMIIQLLFGGAIVTVRSMGSVMATLSMLVVSRWTFGGIGQVVHMNDRIAGDQNFSANSPYDPSFFDVPFPITLVILGAFLAVMVSLMAVLLGDIVDEGRYQFLPSTGSDFAGYRLEALIARGGMGVVYSATHLRLSRKVALKLLAPELAEDTDFRERFLREARVAAGLEHPHVVPVYDAGEEQGVLFLAMRYLAGGDLRELLQRQGRLSLERALSICEQIAGALDAAHEAGLVHRDVKPANILFSERREHAYLADFGVAKRQSSKGLTHTGSFLGSVDYCAPEQIESAVVDGRADVYALGGVVYHCLTGQPPYVRETEVAVLSAHLRDPPPALSRVRPDLPPALDGVIVTAMAKYPQVRYETAGAFAQALRSALTERAPETVRAEVPDTRREPPPPPPPGESATVAFPAPDPTRVAPTPQGRRRRLLFASLAGVLVLAAGGAGAAVVLLIGSGGEPTASGANTTTPPAETTSPPPSPPSSPNPQPLVKARERKANKAYAGAIDEMLIDSARTRSDLGTLIEGATAFSIPYEEAAAAIDGITEQRRSLLAAVSAVAVPPAFSRSSTLLRRSLVASINDDLAISNWIDAKYAGDLAAEDYHWKRQLKLSTEASAAKTTFLREYNAKRRALLDRPPLDVRY